MKNTTNTLKLEMVSSYCRVGKGKQGRPRSDEAERGAWSGSSLFAYIIYY